MSGGMNCAKVAWRCFFRKTQVEAVIQLSCERAHARPSGDECGRIALTRFVHRPPHYTILRAVHDSCDRVFSYRTAIMSKLAGCYINGNYMYY